MEQTHPLLERLIFPTLCLVVAALMLYEQATGAYRAESRVYILFLAIPVFLLSLFDLVCVLRHKLPEPPPAADTDHAGIPLPYIRPVTFLAVALIGISVISDIGFPIVFSALCVTAMLLLGERRLLRLATLPAVIVTIVHFIFVGVLGLDLPYGALWNA